ncbi:MAG: calcium-translocating P-type ATPase, PMCA-type [Clostridiales bacterium]|nr:calcium-translocating P-type ATPase, PMCA-type [Clostridiales bacterium]
MQYYSKDFESVLTELGSKKEGLTGKEAEERLFKNGKNELEQPKKKSLIQKFFAQFKDVMILVLIAAALISAAIAIFENELAELFDSAIIMLIVILNAIIGLVQENKAENALEALKNMNKPFCKVIRNGELISVKSEEIVVGDIVSLEAGDLVPADLRLIDSHSLKIEEAALTGESVPAEKDANAICDEKAPLGDRVCMAYSGGTVAYGRGLGVVVATGMQTEVGKIAKMLINTEESDTPLQKQLAGVTKVLSIVILVIAVIIFGAELLVKWTDGDIKSVIIESFMSAIAIAVAAMPEGLPAVVTIVLALGVQKMSKRNAIIRNLPAVETLGCCEVICSDKTGTLTLNQMTVKKLFTLSEGLVNEENFGGTSSQKMLVETMALCNDSKINGDAFVGDPTETALVYYARKVGYDYAELNDTWKRIDEVPFDSVRKLMTTVNKNGEEKLARIKGATDILLNRCKYILDGDTVRDITEEDIENIKKANYEMATKALRVLGVAIKKETDDMENIEQDLTFVGLVGMIDPPRPEVKKAVATCFEAGIRPIMITGDHIDTASAIAKEIGILREGDKVMLGAEIDKLSDEEFAKVIREYSVFARVSPENKVRIVKTYKSFGNVVAMTGDGVNDAPSIKEADIGIGMGITGTDVSKGAADMILVDDNFSTIVGAVEEGRKIFSNIKKAIQFLLSANIAEVLCLFIATVFLRVDFLLPVMILWVNLVTDSLPALALGTEEAEKDVMKFKPRKSNESMFRGKMGKDIIIQGVMQTILVLASFCIGNYILEVNNHAAAMTMAFVSLCMIQLFHSYNMRSQHNSVFNRKIFSNKSLNIAFIVGVILMLAVILIPGVNALFGTSPLNLIEWVISVGISILIIPFVEIQKWIERKIAKKKGKSIL